MSFHYSRDVTQRRGSYWIYNNGRYFPVHYVDNCYWQPDENEFTNIAYYVMDDYGNLVPIPEYTVEYTNG